MTVTNHYYGGTATGAGKIVPDFGLCDLKGIYLYTAKARTKGLMVVTFFAPEQAASANVLKAVNGWTADIATAKWTPIAVADADRDTLSAFADTNDLDKLTIVVDHEGYQTQTWGVSHIPSTFLVAGNGRILRRIVGDSAADLAAVRETLGQEVNRIVAAEEAAKEAARKAEEEKKAAEAAAAAAKPAEPAPAAKA